MAEPTTTTRRPARCSKHAFAPRASWRPRNDVAQGVTLPAHRHQTCLGQARLASETAGAGDDPVNAVDPLGASIISSAWDDTAGKVVHGVKTAAVDTGNFFSDPSRWRDEANYWAGVGNGIVSTVTFGQVHIAAPYCDALSWAYGVGSGFGYAISAVGGGAAAEAVTGAAGATEAAASAEEADSAVADATFGHGARHLAGTLLSPADVESAIGSQIQGQVANAAATGSFWGRVSVDGIDIEYRAYTLPDGTINVGTYYVAK